ncbi:MAG: hypothetical protein AAF907_18060, partial [Planctomycetota bacterium]
ADAPEATPRTLPFPSRAAETTRRRTGDKTARRRMDGIDGDGRAVTLRFHGPHADSSAAAGLHRSEETPDVLPLSAILSPPRFRDGSVGQVDAPAGAIAGRIDSGWAKSPVGVSCDSPLTRAKVLHANRVCPACGAGGVEPVLLNDGVRDASGQPVPGSGTLVGFHCSRCQREWPVG